MSNFHTTVNRRDFMKLLGVTGTGLGLGAAATINPTFRDFDEVISLRPMTPSYDNDCVKVAAVLEKAHLIKLYA